MDSAANQCAILDAENAMTENRHGGAKDDGNANKIVQIRRPSQVVMGWDFAPFGKESLQGRTF